MKNPPSRKGLLLWLSIALYLISMPMDGEALSTERTPLYLLLAAGWVSLFGLLLGGGSIFALIFGIWLSNVMAVCAVITRDYRAVLFALCAVLLGAPALFTFPYSLLPHNNQVHAPTVGTYIWFSSYCLLLVYCVLNDKSRTDDVVRGPAEAVDSESP